MARTIVGDKACKARRAFERAKAIVPRDCDDTPYLSSATAGDIHLTNETSPAEAGLKVVAI